jgi:Rrf2 family transcriptional regulator, cysteine metabolism repressor
MKLSTKGRYGTRASIELALRYGAGPVMVREIADCQDISERYLEHILNTLRASGLVRSTRGAHGGYELSRHPSTITLGDIVTALEGPMDIVECTGDSNCPKISHCVMCEIWTEVKHSIESVLNTVTLQEAADRHQQLQQSRQSSPEYSI